MIPPAGSEIGADRQPDAAPWDGSRRLWSLWDMVNFQFYAIIILIHEIHLHISVSRHNMEWVDAAGGYHTALVKNDEAAPEAIRQSLEGIAYIKELYSNTVSQLKCSHIDRAMESLENWPHDKSPYWSELNARARALCNAIETELREYLYFQYPKQKGQN